MRILRPLANAVVGVFATIVTFVVTFVVTFTIAVVTFVGVVLAFTIAVVAFCGVIVISTIIVEFTVKAGGEYERGVLVRGIKAVVPMRTAMTTKIPTIHLQADPSSERSE